MARTLNIALLLGHPILFGFIYCSFIPAPLVLILQRQ